MCLAMDALNATDACLRSCSGDATLWLAIGLSPLAHGPGRSTAAGSFLLCRVTYVSSSGAADPDDQRTPAKPEENGMEVFSSCFLQLPALYLIRRQIPNMASCESPLSFPTVLRRFQHAPLPVRPLPDTRSASHLGILPHRRRPTFLHALWRMPS